MCKPADSKLESTQMHLLSIKLTADKYLPIPIFALSLVRLRKSEPLNAVLLVSVTIDNDKSSLGQTRPKTNTAR